MGRLAASLLLAILIHALLLLWAGPFQKPDKAETPPQVRMVTMTLFQSDPGVSEPMPLKQPKPPEKTEEPPVAPQPEVKRKPLPSPSLKKKVPVPSPIKKPETKTIAKETHEAGGPSEPVSQIAPVSQLKPGQNMGNSESVREASPLYKQNPPPKYPATEVRRGNSGTVLLQVLVDPSGRVRELRVIRSSGYPMLDRAAMKAVKNWDFEPGRKGETPIEMWVNVPVVFKLES